MFYNITSLTQQKKDRSRISVFLDGEFSFGITKATALNLHVGQKISDSEIQQIKAKDEMEYAFQRACHFIHYRPRSTDEIRNKLIKLEFSNDTVEKTILRIKEIGMIDDRQFTKDWVESRSSCKPRSKWLISRELRQKGIPEQIILAETDMISDSEMAKKLVEKYLRRVDSSSWETFRTRLGGFLQRKGFNYEVINPIIHEAWNEALKSKSN